MKLNKPKYSLYILSAVIVVLVGIIAAIVIMQSTSHTHDFGDWEIFKEPSCSEYGVERRFCSCGEIQEKKNDKTPHIEGEWIVDTEKNEKNIFCTVCGKRLKTESLGSHTHSFGDWSVEIEPTCTKGGIMSRSCRCGAREEKAIKVLDHTFGDWITVKEAECGIAGLIERSCTCGKKEEKETSPLYHIYGSWSVTKSPTCNIEGEEARFCINCNHKETRPIDALSHQEGGWKIENGIKKFYCSNCGTVLREEEIAVTTNLDISNGVVIGIGSCINADIEIPKKHNGVTVVEIAENAFERNSSITSIKIPNGVTTIGSKAFYNCDSLKTVELSNNITTIGNRAFAHCYSLESIYISSSVEHIGLWAFECCVSLTTINYGGTIEEWHNLVADSDWDEGIPNYTVYCTNGQITK